MLIFVNRKILKPMVSNDLVKPAKASQVTFPFFIARSNARSCSVEWFFLYPN